MLNAESIALATGTLVPHRGPIGARHIRSLIDAAADAGFNGVEFRTICHDWAVADGMRSEEFFDYHHERGLSLVVSEFSDTWVTSDRRAIAEANADIIDLTARAGGSLILAVARELPSFQDAAAGLAALADLAADHGVGVSLEFLAYGGVATIATAAQLLDAVERDNVGLCLDTWQWLRQPGGPDIATLRDIPPERIQLLQLNDAPIQPADDLFTETLTARLLPGDGAIDILGLLDTLDDIGAAPIVVSEVFSSSLAALDPYENARQQYAAACEILRSKGARSEQRFIHRRD